MREDDFSEFSLKRALPMFSTLNDTSVPPWNDNKLNFKL